MVLVPLNRREEVGVVWDGPSDETVPDHKLKPLIARLDTPPMAEPMRRFIDWIAAYTLTPPGEVMAMALRVVRAAPGSPHAGWRAADPRPEIAHHRGPRRASWRPCKAARRCRPACWRVRPG